MSREQALRRKLAANPKGQPIAGMNDTLTDTRRVIAFLFVSNFLLYLGFQVWQTMFNNFAVEQLGIGPASVGWIQALRELPGLFGFLLGFIALYLSELRIMGLSAILLGAGLMLTGQSYAFPLLLVATVVMSIGFHYYAACNSAVVLMIMEKQHAPSVLGRLGSQGSIAAVLGTLAVYLLAGPLGYRALFMIVGALIIAGGALLLTMGGAARQCLPTGRRIRLRRRYWLYYCLSFLIGSRRHIATTFAIFLLVRDYHINVQTTALLFLVTSLVNIFALRLSGRLITRWGERLVLSVTFATLALVFLGYAFIPLLPVLFVLFVLDNVFFSFNLANTTYFQKIAVTHDEITSNVAVEQTINHVAAVVVPVVGGTLWTLLGSQAPFLIGVGIVVVALALTQFMRPAPAPGKIASAAEA